MLNWILFICTLKLTFKFWDWIIKITARIYITKLNWIIKACKRLYLSIYKRENCLVIYQCWISAFRKRIEIFTMRQIRQIIILKIIFVLNCTLQKFSSQNKGKLKQISWRTLYIFNSNVIIIYVTFKLKVKFHEKLPVKVLWNK